MKSALGAVLQPKIAGALLAAGLVGCSPATETASAALLAQNLQSAEGLLDAFYSFDPEQLNSFLSHAGHSAKPLLYYQGWAEGGNYQIVQRADCVAESAKRIRCDVTVQDDPVLALQTGFNVTDTFSLTFDGPDIVAIDTSSNDQPIYYEAQAWVVENMPEVMAGPCKGYFDGGPSPGDCARAMTEGYRQFHAAKAAKNATDVQDASDPAEK